MDNIFNVGDKYIHFKDGGAIDTGTIINISLSQVCDGSGFCYEVINLHTDNQAGRVLSIGQTRGSIHKMNYQMSKDELDLFKDVVYIPEDFPTKFE